MNSTSCRCVRFKDRGRRGPCSSARDDFPLDCGAFRTLIFLAETPDRQHLQVLQLSLVSQMPLSMSFLPIRAAVLDANIESAIWWRRFSTEFEFSDRVLQ